MCKRSSVVLCIAAVLLGALCVHAADSRVTLPGGKKIFLSGMNLAWIKFANDVGDTPLDTTAVKNAMKAVSDSGGNCMRIWLSTNGVNDPKFDSDGLVSGPASKTISNIQQMLQLAKRYNMLVMPVLLTHGWVNPDQMAASQLEKNIRMLQTEEGLNAYVNNYVKKVVKEIGNDPNLVCWEVCNEPEGMYQQWNNKETRITQLEIQRLVNWVAAAVHETVPGVLVSNGSAGLDFRDWYRDAALKGIDGGKESGTLDFYMIHFYGWNGSASSPFQKPCSYWNLDKPLVIGEFPSSDWNNDTKSSTPCTDGGGKVDTLLKYLDNNGYAGGMGWQYQPDDGDKWLKGFTTFGHSLAEVYRMDSNSIKLTSVSAGNFIVSAAASSGGSVAKSVSGRIDSLGSITLTASASDGYTFTGWTGDTACADAVLTIEKVVKDWSLVANFKPDEGTNLVKSGDFSDESAWASWFDEKTNEAVINFDDEQANITITESDTVNWEIQISQSGIPIDSGAGYTLSFDAWSTEERVLHVGVTTAATYNYQGGEQVTLTGDKKNYTVAINCDTTCNAGVVQFNCGNATLPVYIDNVFFVKNTGDHVLKKSIARRNNGIAFNYTGNKISWNASSRNAAAMLVRLNGTILKSSITAKTLSIADLPSGHYLFVVNNGMVRETFGVTKF